MGRQSIARPYEVNMQRRFLVGAILFAFGLVGAAQAKPNFTGDWKLNPDKSDFGPMPPPSSMSAKIDHADPDLKVSTQQSGAQGDMSFDAKYTTDGKESTNSMGPIEAKSTVNWEGNDLAINTKVDANGMQLAIKGKWAMSEDGKTMTQTAHFTSPQGEFDMKLVFDKQAK